MDRPRSRGTSCLQSVGFCVAPKVIPGYVCGVSLENVERTATAVQAAHDDDVELIAQYRQMTLIERLRAATRAARVLQRLADAKAAAESR